MTKAPPIRSAGPPHARSPIPPPAVRPCRHTAAVSIRYSVQAPTREECVQGLELFVRMGLVPVMLPVQVMDDRWMARAVPPPTTEPLADGQGPDEAGD